MTTVGNERLVFELSSPGRRGATLPPLDVEPKLPKDFLPENLLRSVPPELPEVSEPQLVRHYTRLSQLNYGVDSGMYPLGSCTMKYNPKIDEDLAALPAFAKLHPYQPESDCQAAIQVMGELSGMLSEITGMDAFSLQPAAGAHGELAGLMIIKAYHQARGEANRSKIIVPDSSHGTNPASAALAGFSVVSIPSSSDGMLDLDALASVLGPDVAGLMLTNPNTLGLFETGIAEVVSLVHNAGGLVYYDGANMNAIMGRARPADMGFDLCHINIHKTFAAPHGGGGPGAGPVGVRAFLADFLPGPIVTRAGDGYRLFDPPSSIGRVRSFFGPLPVLVKAWTYIRSMGGAGLREASETAVLNANYVKERLKDLYRLPYGGICMHEFVFDGLAGHSRQVHTLDVAKRLIDYGFHPPTVYFPLIVANAIMVEPTESEDLETLDSFVDAMRAIAREAVEDPDLLLEAPHATPVRRIDDTLAARKPVLTFAQGKESQA